MDTKVLRLRPAWWTLILITTIVTFTLVCSAFYIGSFRPYDTVTLTSDRAGLVMETGARVEMRGVEIGQVGAISGGREPVTLTLEITPNQMQYIPANVQAEIRATTAFGAKYVDLVPPADPSPARLAPGAVLRSRNVSTEVNTVFENLVGLPKQIDVAKLNSILTPTAEGARGHAPRIGQPRTRHTHPRNPHRYQSGAPRGQSANGHLGPQLAFLDRIQRRLQRGCTRYPRHPQRRSHHQHNPRQP